MLRSLLPALLVLVLSGSTVARESKKDNDPVNGIESLTIDEFTPVAVPQPTAQAIQYYETGTWLWAFDNIWVLAIPALLLFTGFSARLYTLATRIGRVWVGTVAVYLVLYLFIDYLIDLPLSYYQGFVRQHSFGMSHQSLDRWFGNSLKRLAVSLVVAAVVGWIPFYLIKKSPRRWWLYATLLTIPFGFFAMLVSPIWIDPLFNRYGPLSNPILESKILDEARRAGIDGGRIYEVDKSVDSKALNAYVKGVFDTKRIVLYDTLTKRLSEREVLAVLGHEMGHYVLGHVHKTLLLSSILVLAGLFWIDRAGRWLIARFYKRFGFDQLASVAALPLILLLMQVSAFVFSPLAYAYSRAQEHEADRFALELTRTNHSAAMAFVKLQQENLSNPRPGLFFTIFRASHPSIGERIDFCNAYRPWTKGEPLVYGALFRQ